MKKQWDHWSKQEGQVEWFAGEGWLAGVEWFAEGCSFGQMAKGKMQNYFLFEVIILHLLNLYFGRMGTRGLPKKRFLFFSLIKN